MSLSVNNNAAALNTYRNLTSTQGSLSKSLEKLSSGYRINRAADDAAGLAISEGLRSQINGLTQASRNTQDGINVVQTAEGALNESTSILQRMRTLAVQSSNDSNDPTSRAAINAESTALKAELDRIADKTTFNGVKLLDGNFTSKQFQVGALANDTISVDVTQSSGPATFTTTAAGTGVKVTTAGTFTIGQSGGATVTTGTIAVTTSAATTRDALNADANFSSAYFADLTATGELRITAVGNASAVVTVAAGTGVGAGLTTGTGATAGAASGFSSTNLGVNGVNLSTQAGSASAITAIDTAIKAVSTARANLGALQNRFEHTINNLNVSVENLTASESQIRDTDMASEMVKFTSKQILSQAGTAMLAQAKSLPQSILSLLQN